MSQNEPQSEPPSELDDVIKKYAEIISKVTENRDQYMRAKDNDLNELIHETDILFEKIKKPTTLKLDARFLTESTQISCTRFEKHLRSVDISTEKLIDSVSNRSIAAYKFCEIVKAGFCGVQFPRNINLEANLGKKQIQRRNTAKQNELEIVSPTIPQKVTEVNKNEALLLKRVDLIREVLNEQNRVEYFRLVIDPFSFSNTVENMFYLAFAVKSNYCNLEFDNDILFVVHNKSTDKLNKSRSIDSGKTENDRHMIVSLTYEEYKTIIKNLNINKPMLFLNEE
ncbi:hypothetical protein EDEG_03262 [Edhazardia aedis USNM 41457]|uniref:Non-structural maintenance of chromosomes element 4 n=1 Tax=Edhazardia aedis (strain USNM 41457) TaxID=1003232 RepID=J8ZRH4_EDHAE|nr:hypothetical protein EDEG_03262 [Edhazardia aedis USNM 41457]|eukprot:EJW02298.1 hypothetical protein EDEG_03262 [Edhazardia aedis USNM 41457]